VNISINEQLRALYENHYEKLKQKFNVPGGNNRGDSPANPLLIQVDEEKYKASDIKLMFFGKETNGWEGQYGERINELLDTYQKFLVDGKDQGHFGNALRDYMKTIQIKYPEKKIDYVWNNILKVGKAKGKGTPSSEIIIMQQEYFPVIKFEMEILKPDIIVFFTGPSYDKYIKYEFPDVKFMVIQDVEEKEFCKVDSALLPDKAFRTYHPQHLCFKGKAYMSFIKDSIISSI
jgi:hypothetical protein